MPFVVQLHVKDETNWNFLLENERRVFFRFSSLSLYTWVAFKVQNTLFVFRCVWWWFEDEIQSRRSLSISSIRISQMRTSELQSK